MSKKNRIIKWLWLLSVLLPVLTDCTVPEESVPDVGQTRIRLALEESAYGRQKTRTAVSVFNGDTIAFAAGSFSGTYSEIWKAKGEGSEAIPLQPRYYPEDGSRLYLRGYYPAAVPGINGVTWHLDGSQDVMVSNEQSGSLTDMFWQDSKKFTFTHLLTRLNIRVRVEEGFPVDARLTRIRIGGSHPDVLLDLNKGALSAMGESAVLTVWEADRTGLLLSDAFPDTPIATAMLEAGVPLTFFATVTLSDGTVWDYEALPIRFAEADGLPKAGVSYTLSVVLDAEKEKLILSTTVTDWTEREGGDIIV